MRKIIISAFFIFIGTMSLFAQAGKPNAMVMPDNEWCIKKGYTDPNNPSSPDYNKALMDNEFAMCVVQFSGIMAERGYQLKDLSSVMESYKTGKAKRMVMTGKDGSQVLESEEDMLARAAALDIKIRFAINKKSALGRNQVEFLVKAVDAATDETIWAEPFTPVVTSAPANTVLAGAVAGKMDSFCNGLQRFFDNMANQGRKCTIEMNISDSCPLNFGSDITVGDQEGELSEFISTMMNETAAPGGVIETAKEDNMMNFEAFVPLTTLNMAGKPQATTAEKWIKNSLNKCLKPLGLQMKTSMFGQGKVYCLISGM